MGWSLSRFPPKDPAALDAFFLVVGKALYIANEFEWKCKYVLRMLKMANFYVKSGDAFETIDFAANLKDRLLGMTISELKDFPEIRPRDIEILDKAREARNDIAHDGAIHGQLHNISAAQIHQKVTWLRTKVETLAEGDNVVSRWVYEIGEKVPAPVVIQKDYPKWVVYWVFGPEESP